MKTLIKIAWRNIFRNKRRTVLSGIAVGLGLASLMFVDALLEGMFRSMILTATNTFMGQGQIHAKGFSDTFDVELTIKNPTEVLEGLKDEPLIKAYTPRTLSFGMVTSPSDVGSVIIYGIDPAREQGISMLDDAIVEGEFLKPEDTRRILIGSKVAEVLDVGPGDRVVVTVSQAGTGDLSQEMLRVAGVFRFNVREADSGMAYMHIDKARELLGLGRFDAHEIALKFTDIDDAGNRALPFWGRYTGGGNEAKGWRDIVPQLDAVIELSNLSTGITTMLVFAVVALTIMNTLFMSLYERMFEFGVLRAIGTRPLSMAMVIVLEAASLSVICMLIGTALGFLVTWYFTVHGVDYVGIEFAGVTLRELIYPAMRPRQFTLFPAMILGFSLVASLYPALFAARLTPAQAMRRSI